MHTMQMMGSGIKQKMKGLKKKVSILEGNDLFVVILYFLFYPTAADGAAKASPA